MNVRNELLLIHGLGQNSSSWDKTISYMVDEYSIICPDLSSFFKEKDVTYSNLYKSFSKYCNNISEPLNLCGLSLGGVIALNYAIDNPTKVKSLVLIATQYKMPKALLNVQNVIFRFLPQNSFKDMGVNKEDFINLTKSMMELNFSQSLKNISCPVLIICGERDIANKKASKNLAESIPNAKIQFIKNARHELNVDAPKELAEIINNFYNKHTTLQ